MSTIVTVTDMFCGAGGSSQGAVAAGAEVRMAANHWQLAIETHNTNFPNTDHDCADINQVDPRRWPRTTVLWASPECTNHSVGKGKKRFTGQLDMFRPQAPDPEAERSRATMWDVPRFAEFHHYDAILVENVVDARKWILFDAWIHAMQLLGYNYRILYLNSMFFGVPQSRDRMYVVFWKNTMRAPDLDFRPWAICPACDKSVQAVQSWKHPAPWGRYGEKGQYLYLCPDCAGEAVPFITPSLVAIDWSDQGERIGDKAQPLKPRTMDRIRAGLDKFGSQYLMVDLAHTHSMDVHSKPVLLPLMTQTTAQTVGLVSPFVLDTSYDGAGRVRAVADPLLTQTARRSQALAIPPAAIVVLRNHGDAQSPAEPMATITAGGNHHALLQMPFFLGYANGDSPPRPATEPLHTIHTEPGHGVVMPFVLNMRGNDGYARGADVGQPMPTVTTSPPFGLVMPFITSYYRTGSNRPVDEPMGTISTVDRHALVQPAQRAIDDCYFRMLKPPEIGRGMAFRDNYVVLGNSRQQVRQYGNAVTPPVSEWLFSRIAEILS